MTDDLMIVDSPTTRREQVPPGAKLAAVGTALNDMLDRHGYKRAETAAVLAASAAMGETIPPSITMVVLGSLFTLSIASLSLAGVIPAPVIAVILMATVYIRARLLDVPTELGQPISASLILALRAAPAMSVPLILVGGIVFGAATPTEASSLAVVYALLISTVVYRAMGIRSFVNIVIRSATISGMILFLTSSAAAFSWVWRITTCHSELVN